MEEGRPGRFHKVVPSDFTLFTAVRENDISCAVHHLKKWKGLVEARGGKAVGSGHTRLHLALQQPEVQSAPCPEAFAHQPAVGHLGVPITG